MLSMAKSRSQKQKAHKLRNGEMVKRENYLAEDYSLHERKTQTKIGKKRKRYNKHKGRKFSEYDKVNQKQLIMSYSLNYSMV